MLIIEDEPNILESLVWLLRREGFEVATETDGGAAVERVGRERPDLLILDAMLPHRDGFEILRELRAGAATARLPVIMLTARGQQRDRATAEGLGVDLFITKPFANADIVASARRLAPG